LPGQKFHNHLWNFEHAPKHAKRDVILLSDQDDLWVSGKVKAVMEALQDADLVNTDHSVIDEEGEVLMPSYFGEVESRPGWIKNFIKCSYFGCCMAFRRELLEASLPFPPSVSSHDFWLGYVANLLSFKVKFLPFVLTQYRKHRTNLSSATNIVSPYSLPQKIGFRLQLLRATPALLLLRAVGRRRKP
jgi:hypothetical protein